MSFAGVYGDMHWDNQHCPSALISAISYFLAKHYLYQLFVIRLYTIYNHSSFRYPIKLLATISIVAFIACVAWIVWACLKLEIEDQSVNGYGCIIYSPPLFNESGAFLDLIISCVCLYLFLKPLLALIKAQKQVEMKMREMQDPPSTSPTSGKQDCESSQSTKAAADGDGDIDDSIQMYFAAEKYTLLSVIGIMSSFFILVIVGIFGGSAFIIIDGVINCAVVGLMNERYNDLYTRTCGPCRKCQSVCIQCCCCCRKK